MGFIKLRERDNYFTFIQQQEPKPELKPEPGARIRSQEPELL